MDPTSSPRNSPLYFAKLMTKRLPEWCAAMETLMPSEREIWWWLVTRHKIDGWCVRMSQEAIAEAISKSPGMVRKTMSKLRAAGLAKAYTTKTGGKAVMLNPAYVRFSGGSQEAYHLKLWAALPLTGGQEKKALRSWAKEDHPNVED